jgi:hypothetical protein
LRRRGRRHHMDSARVGLGRNMPLLASPDPATFCREKPSIGGRAVRRQRGKGGREEGTDWSTLRRTSRVSVVLRAVGAISRMAGNKTTRLVPAFITPTRPAPRPHEPWMHHPLSMPRYAALSTRHLHFPMASEAGSTLRTSLSVQDAKGAARVNLGDCARCPLSSRAGRWWLVMFAMCFHLSKGQGIADVS